MSARPQKVSAAAVSAVFGAVETLVRVTGVDRLKLVRLLSRGAAGWGGSRPMSGRKPKKRP